jgi:membrane protease YdiL (CAAX protease family)
MLLRGYVPAVLNGRHRHDAVAFVSGALFIFHHIFNLEYYGYSTLFCLNVFLIGVWFCYLVRLEGNFWIVCGVHTAWNYVQAYLFGAPNSGQCYPVSLMKGENSASSFFFNYVYGFEGCLCTTAVLIALIMFTLVLLKRKNAGLSEQGNTAGAIQ